MVNNPVCSKTSSKFTGSEILGAKTKKDRFAKLSFENDAQDTHYSLQYHPGVYDHGQLFSLPLLPDNSRWRTE